MTESTDAAQESIQELGPGPGAVLAHPIVVVMLVLWIVNDHILKDLLGNAFTGKLSDITSLAVFPLIPVACYEIICGLRGISTKHLRLVLVLSLIATGSVMIGINLWESWANAYRVGLGLCQWPVYALGDVFAGHPLRPPHTVYLTMDPTDIWTLPSLAIPAWLQIRTDAQRQVEE